MRHFSRTPTKCQRFMEASWRPARVRRAQRTWTAQHARKASFGRESATALLPDEDKETTMTEATTSANAPRCKIPFEQQNATALKAGAKWKALTSMITMPCGKHSTTTCGQCAFPRAHMFPRWFYRPAPPRLQREPLIYSLIPCRGGMLNLYYLPAIMVLFAQGHAQT